MLRNKKDMLGQTAGTQKKCPTHKNILNIANKQTAMNVDQNVALSIFRIKSKLRTFLPK